MLNTSSVKQTIFSGIQPTGDLQLGNYIGAVSNWVSLQSDSNNKNIYCIVDSHAITVFQDPVILKNNIIKLASYLLAVGIDPSKSVLFVQSTNHNHAELAWILNCIARVGWLDRMTQFKDKAKDGNKEKSSVGLYTYPVLQAADILLYDASLVPIGDDQKQHIELARDIAMRFNRDYKKDIFKIPEPLFIKNQSRIMSLKDASKKMSKSDTNQNSRISLSDSNEDIAKKISKATTDSLQMPISPEELTNRLEVNNLLNIYSFISKQTIQQSIQEFAGQGFANFKNQLTELLINTISPIRDKQKQLYANSDYLKAVLNRGLEESYSISSKKMVIIKDTVGFIT